MLINFLLAFLSSIFTGVSQVLLKLGAKQGKGIKIFINIYTIIGYFIFFLITLVNLYVYKFLEMKYAVIFMPLGFLFVIIFSLIILKEKISKNKIIGILFIIIGVIIFNFNR